MILYHNPACSKSRETKSILEKHQVSFDVKNYLDAPISASEIKEILQKLGFSSAKELMRQKESIYQELQLDKIDDETQLIEAMLTHPKLIERPILVSATTAIIGRPPENVLRII